MTFGESANPVIVFPFSERRMRSFTMDVNTESVLTPVESLTDSRADRYTFRDSSNL